MSDYFVERWYYSPIFWEIFIIDWISKLAAYSFFQRPIIITQFLSFRFSLNTGVAWSFLASHEAFAYYGLTIGIFIVLSLLAKYATDRQLQGYNVTGETLILAGGFANFVDRILHRGVIDFIKISYDRWSFPVFNIADIAITVGAIIILYEFCCGSE